ncbi:MAG TPA: DUF6206 family protein [Candidatus Binatia bacterium]|nr:DUF6206 family protein [Candidatus Binatia bacterium]
MRALEPSLVQLERRLDPADPTRAGVEILGYGEVSAVIGLGEFPDLVFKRMSGFASDAAGAAYAGVVERYVTLLREIGVAVARTELVQLSPSARRHVVYVVQPRLAADGLGHVLLRNPAVDLAPLLEPVFALVRRVLDANATRRDGIEIAVDAQLSNWHWANPGDAQCQPTLIDVSTPFMRRDGALEVGVDVFLRAYPGLLRWWLRRTRAVERYIDDYFDFGLVVRDLLGNFVKEGARARIPAMIDCANQWIARQPNPQLLGHVDEAAVHAYYRRDAATLETSLRARRFARFVTTRLLRRRYDFILPGDIRR